MTLTLGSRVRTIVDLRATDHSLVPSHSIGHVYGHRGELLLVEVEDAFGQSRTIECQAAQVRPA